MKTKDIAMSYSIDRENFEEYIRNVGLEFKMSFSNMIIEDANVQQYVGMYMQAKQNDEQAAIAKNQVLSRMLISSGFSFEGYRIVKYSGYISGDDAIQIPRGDWFTKNKRGGELTNALVEIRRQALIELKEAAYNLGCNAVIGVDFDYLTLEPERNSALSRSVTVYEPYIVCVTANGNAVVIEKIEE